jgi:hypothetical protein
MELESAKAEAETAAQAAKIINAGELLLSWRGRVFEWIMFGLLRSKASTHATNDSYHGGYVRIKLAAAVAGNHYLMQRQTLPRRDERVQSRQPPMGNTN